MGFGIWTKFIKGKNLIVISLYTFLFLLGIKTLFHGFPDIERFFAEWWDERLTLTYIMKFGTLNFAPTQIWHPPLYHYLTFVPIALFYLFGRIIGFFADKTEFIRYYFYNTHYFLLIGRVTSYAFFWGSALMIFKICRLFYNRLVSHITTLAFLLVPRFIFDFSTTRPETLLFLNTSIFTYFALRFYLNNKQSKYILSAAFFLGVSTATKYNAVFLGVIILALLYAARQVIFKGTYKKFIMLCLKILSLAFLGFFLCDPFFIVQFKKFAYNFMLYNLENKYYWDAPATFLITHAKDLGSLVYINIFGMLILLLGIFRLFKEEKSLFFPIAITILLYEAYFGIYLSQQSPLRYLNPVMPLVALVFSAGVNFILEHKKKFIPVLFIFFCILAYNFLDIWYGLSFRPTYIQEVRKFIEKTTPEFTNICIASDSFMPQLNMTRQTYLYLINTAPKAAYLLDCKIKYINMDDESRYNSVYRELRIESMTQRPQYNLIRWDTNLNTQDAAVKFLVKNKIKYIVSYGQFTINKQNAEKIEGIELVKEFKPKNRRVYGNNSLYLYRANLDYNE